MREALKGNGTEKVQVPVAGATENFSPRPRIEPPPPGSFTSGSFGSTTPLAASSVNLSDGLSATDRTPLGSLAPRACEPFLPGSFENCDPQSSTTHHEGLNYSTTKNPDANNLIGTLSFILLFFIARSGDC
jgi:hypothetical protein